MSKKKPAPKKKPVRKAPKAKSFVARICLSAAKLEDAVEYLKSVDCSILEVAEAK